MLNHKDWPVHRLSLPVALAYMAAVLLMSSVPGVIPEDGVTLYRVFVWVPPGIQNFMHIPVYAGLAFVWCGVLDPRLSRRWCILGAFLIATGFGVIDEWYQSFIPGRFSSLGDIISNALGAAIGVGVFSHIRGRNAAESDRYTHG